MQTFRASSADKVNAARSWARDGFDAVKAGHLAKAKACFSNAARELPDDYRLLANIARTEFTQGNVAKAISTMEAALADSEDPGLRVELGEMRLSVGQWLAANRDAELALQDDFRLSVAWKLKGKLAMAKGDQQAALLLFQRAMGLNKFATDEDELQMLIAEICVAMGKPMQALSATESILSRYPPNQQPEAVVLAKADALIAMKHLAPAIDVLEVASRSPQCSKEVFLQLGRVQLQAGLPQRALATLTTGQRSFPQENRFEELLVECSGILGNDRARGLMRPSVSPHRVASVPAEPTPESRRLR